LKTDANGNVVASNGAVIQGAELNKDGMLVLPDGTIVDPDDVVIGADGIVRTKDGKVLDGLTADTSAVPGLDAKTYNVDYIVGGVSKDGIAEVNEVPVVEK
jgi:pilus assembly protein CpaB